MPARSAKKATTGAKTARSIADEINGLLKSNVLRMGSDPALKVEYLATGVLPIDMLTYGGLPRGRFVVMQGDWSTLKSYIGLCAIAKTQQAGGVAALIDTENAYDPAWADKIGVNTDELIVWPDRNDPDVIVSGEMAIDVAEALIRNGVDLLVFDSVSATLPQAERSKRLHDENVQPARLAALMSLACRKLTAANSRTAVLWINQLRMNVGITFGNPEVATGGRALPYYASYILDIKKTGKITRDIKTYDGEGWKSGKEQYGQKFKASIIKSKLSKPFRDIHFVWNHDEEGVDEASFLMAAGLEYGVIKQSAASWQYNGSKISGKENFRIRLNKDPEMMNNLRIDVLTAAGVDIEGPKKPGPKPGAKRRVVVKRRG